MPCEAWSHPKLASHQIAHLVVNQSLIDQCHQELLVGPFFSLTFSLGQTNASVSNSWWYCSKLPKPSALHCCGLGRSKPRASCNCCPLMKLPWNLQQFQWPQSPVFPVQDKGHHKRRKRQLLLSPQSLQQIPAKSFHFACAARVSSMPLPALQHPLLQNGACLQPTVDQKWSLHILWAF